MKLTEEMRTSLERKYKTAFNSLIEIMLQHIDMLYAKLPDNTPDEQAEKIINESINATIKTFEQNTQLFSDTLVTEMLKRMEAQNG